MRDTSTHPLRIVLEKVWAPVRWRLEAAIGPKIALGKHAEALVAAVFLAFNTVLGLFQESCARRTPAALKSRLANPIPSAPVGGCKRIDEVRTRRCARGSDRHSGALPAAGSPSSIEAQPSWARGRIQCRDGSDVNVSTSDPRTSKPTAWRGQESAHYEARCRSAEGS